MLILAGTDLVILAISTAQDFQDTSFGVVVSEYRASEREAGYR